LKAKEQRNESEHVTGSSGFRKNASYPTEAPGRLSASRCCSSDSVATSGCLRIRKNDVLRNPLEDSLSTLLKGSASPLEQTEADQERKRLMKTGESFVYQDVVFDPQLIREAKSVGFEVKAVYVATEDPTLNLGRVLIRVSNGGPFAPISRIPQDHSHGLKQLPAAKKLAGDLMLFDNTVHGRDPRLVAHFQSGKLVKVAREIPKWAQKALGKEFAKWLKPIS